MKTFTTSAVWNQQGELLDFLPLKIALPRKKIDSFGTFIYIGEQLMDLLRLRIGVDSSVILERQCAQVDVRWKIRENIIQ